MTDKHEFDIQDADELMIVKAQEAWHSGKMVKYIAKDGCEISITPGGHVFYNIDDWW